MHQLRHGLVVVVHDGNGWKVTILGAKKSGRDESGVIASRVADCATCEECGGDPSAQAPPGGQ
eukprot:1358525-Prymnesium_polylepis.1